MPANHYQRIEIKPGVTITSEYMPTTQSVAVAVWLLKGSRHETPGQQGITHLLEHMLFKGCSQFDAATLIRTMDLLGGQFDAATGKDLMMLSAQCVQDDFLQALDILASMLQNPLIPDAELLKEKSVILEEISFSLDDPEDRAAERLCEIVWPNHSMSLPVLGTARSVESFTRDGLISHHGDMIRTSPVIISIAGRFNPNTIEDDISSRFRMLHTARTPPGIAAPVPAHGVSIISKPLEQVYSLIGIPWIQLTHPERHLGLVTNMLLGGNMSSQLFQVLREQHGLTYNVGSYEMSYQDCGILVISLSTRPENFSRAVALALECMEQISRGNIKEKDVENAKRSLIRNAILGFEGTSRRCYTLARQEMYLQRRCTLNETIEKIQSITTSKLLDFVRSHLAGRCKSMVSVGPFPSEYESNNEFDTAHLGLFKSEF